MIVATMALLTLKAINRELTPVRAQYAAGEGCRYFSFNGGEATDWLDRTVGARTVNGLTLKQWMQEFVRLMKVDAETASGGGKGVRARKPTG
jgi:hypothetical protein